MEEHLIEFMRFTGTAISFSGIITLFTLRNTKIEKPNNNNNNNNNKGILKGKIIGFMLLTVGFVFQELSIIIPWFN